MDGTCVESVGNSVEVEKHGVTSNEPIDCDKIKEPFVGMMFGSFEEAKDFYEEYGRHKGYTVRKRSTYKGRRGPEVTSALFVCTCEGFYQKTPESDDEGKIKRSCSTMRNGCKARMRVTNVKGTTKWKVTVFSDEHNHKLVTPSKRVPMKSNKQLHAAKDLTENQVEKVPSIFGGWCSNVAFNDKDCWSCLKAVRHRDIEAGDVQAVLTYFRKKQTENPLFFYAIQLDENCRMTNFFWVDARSRMANHYFGDVITFDTTYRMKKYDMPFAPFTGVNHHDQSMFFGCALLQDESESTFVWLFETWLEAMEGRHPVSIITNQDLAIERAVARVFPGTRHRFCLSHIKKKFAEKLTNVYFKKSKFKQAMKICIYYTYTIQEFEDQWASLMVEFELEGNEWLKKLYEIRSSWVPVYNRSTFFAGLNTTGRSESITAFFDGFVSPKTNLRDFVIKYERALNRIYEKERKEDFLSICKSRTLSTKSYLLTHATNIYTRTLFEKFQREFDEVYRYKAVEGETDGEYRLYIVKVRDGVARDGIREEFLVKLNLQTKEGKCGCQHFEFTGILCQHMLKVFVRNDVDEIPPHFIMKRWTKEANRSEVVDADGSVIHDRHVGSEVTRINHICRRSTQLAYMAGMSEEIYEVIMAVMDETFKKVSLMEKDLLKNENDEETPNEAFESPKNLGIAPAETIGSTNQSILLHPSISQTKGRKRAVKVKEKVSNTGRWMGGLEVSVANKTPKPKKCATCGVHGHERCNSGHKKRKPEDSEQDLDDDAMHLRTHETREYGDVFLTL